MKTFSQNNQEKQELIKLECERILKEVSKEYNLTLKKEKVEITLFTMWLGMEFLFNNIGQYNNILQKEGLSEEEMKDKLANVIIDRFTGYTSIIFELNDIPKQIDMVSLLFVEAVGSSIAAQMMSTINLLI